MQDSAAIRRRRRRGVRASLANAAQRLPRTGIAAERIVLDPGIGFGKTVEHNVELLARQQELLALGRPLLVGWSRKSTLGALTGRAVDERLAASVAAALAAVQRGAASCACTMWPRLSMR